MPFSQQNGVEIWYEVTGQGPALVFIHANPFDHDLWMYQTAHFSTWFRVVSIDIRGYGRSEKLTTAFSLEDMCDDVIGVMDDVGIARAICGGCSVGSGIAILLGLDHPDRFDAFILVGGNSGPSDRYQKRIEGYRNDLADYHVNHMRDLVHPQFAQSKLGRHLINMFVEREPRLKGEAIAQVFMAGNHTDMTARLPTLKVPTLVINGELDHSLPAGQRTAGLVPGAVDKILPGTGHACCIEDPAEFDALVIDFLHARGLLPAL
jgi:3-oxoadipate enol-lactonase